MLSLLLLLLLLLFLLVTSGTAGEEDSSSLLRRSLSLSAIAGYEPQTVVTDANAIDLDLQEIVELPFDSEASFHEGLLIYYNGGNTAPYAELTLVSTMLSANVPHGTRLTGSDASGKTVVGSLLGDHSMGSNTINFLYYVSEKQATYVNCRVGALQSLGDSITSGCLAPTGNVMVTDVGSFAYTYNVNEENKNNITLSSLSTERGPSDVFIPTFEKYYNYYSVYDYANDWIVAAFQDAITSDFMRGRGDFSQIGFGPRKAAIVTGVVVLNVFMEVVVRANRAASVCSNGANGQMEFDLARAYFTGSLEGTSGNPQGLLFHQLADDLCVSFRTCGANGDTTQGRSLVNREVLRNFRNGKRYFINQECGNIRVAADGITNEMTVALIQGLLLAVYQRNNNPLQEATSAIFAAAVQPLVFACNQADALILHQNTKLGSTSTDFAIVKRALENNYGCLMVTCARVGGIYDNTTGTYLSEPCTDPDTGVGISTSVPTPQPTTGVGISTPVPTPLPTPSPTPFPTVSDVVAQAEHDGGKENRAREDAIIAGSVLGAVALITLLALLAHCRRKKVGKESDPARHGNSAEFTPADPEKEVA